MLNEERIIIELLDNFAANNYGDFLINNATEDFLFIRPSGNPIDIMGFIEMKTSGDLVDGYSDIIKIHKLEFFSSDVSICVFTLRSSFVYQAIQNSDLATVPAIFKKIKNQWKFFLMQRSSGDSDPSLWNL